MAIFDACKSASARLNGSTLSSFFGNTDKFAMELAELANETAVDVAKGHDWQALKTLGIFSGNGVATEFSLPADFDRFISGVEMYAEWLNRPLCRVRDEYDWLAPISISYSWGRLGDKIKFSTPLPNASEVKFYYITNKIFKDTSGTAKVAATVDSDTPRVPERPIMLGLIWRWRQMKRLEYAEDMSSAEIALHRAIAHDKDSGMIRLGRGSRIDAQVAFDGVITL